MHPVCTIPQLQVPASSPLYYPSWKHSRHPITTGGQHLDFLYVSLGYTPHWLTAYHFHPSKFWLACVDAINRASWKLMQSDLLIHFFIEDGHSNLPLTDTVYAIITWLLSAMNMWEWIVFVPLLSKAQVKLYKYGKDIWPMLITASASLCTTFLCTIPMKWLASSEDSSLPICATYVPIWCMNPIFLTKCYMQAYFALADLSLKSCENWLASYLTVCVLICKLCSHISR